MNRYERIVFAEEEFGDRLWQAVTEQLKLLAEARYICVVKEEEHGIVVIQFQYDRPEWGCAYPYWLYPEEEETVVYKGEEEQCGEE